MSEFRVERIVTHQLYTTAKHKMETGQQYCSWKECIHKKACPHVFNPIQEEKSAKAHCKYIFLVHWEGYSDDEWTWEPEVNLWLDGLMTIAIRRYKKDWPNVGFLPECELVWRERTWREYPDAVLPPAEREGKDKRQFLFEGDLELIMIPEEKKQWDKELRRKEKQKEARDRSAEKAKHRKKKREKEKRRESSYESTDSENELTIRRKDREAAEAAEKRRQQVGAEEKKRLDAQDALEAMERLLSKKNKEKRRSSGGSGKALDIEKDVDMADKEDTSREKKKDKLHPTPPISMEDIFGDDEAREKERQKRKEQKRKQKEREELERKQREKEERQKREELRVMTEEEKQREKKEEEKREEMRREKEKARAKEREKEKNLKKRAEEKKQEKAVESHNPQTLTMLDLFGDMESTKKEKEKREKERRKKKIREMKEKEERERKALEERKKKKEAEEAWIKLGSRSVDQEQSKEREKKEKTVMDVGIDEVADVAMAEPEQAASVVESADTASMDDEGERGRETDGAAEEELEVRLRRMVVQEPYKDPFLYENVRNARRWNSCETLCLFWRKPLRKERFNRLRAMISRRAARTVRALIRPNKNNLVVHFKKTVKNGVSVLRAVDRDRAVLRQNRMRTTIPYEEIIQCEFAHRARAFVQRIAELKPLSEDGETRSWSLSLPVWFVAGHWDYASTFLCAIEQRKEHRAAVLKVLVDMFAADAGYGWVLDEKDPEKKKQHKPYACSSDHRKCRTLTAVLSSVAGEARFSEGGVLPPNAAHLALVSGAGTCVAIALIRAGCPLTGVDGSGHTIGHTAINKCSSNDLRRVLRAGVCMQSPLQAADRESRVRVVDWAKHKAKHTNNHNKRNRITQNVKLVRDVLSRMEVAWRNATDDVFPSFYAITAEIGKARTLRIPEGDTHVQYEELLTIPQSAIDDYLKRETYSTVSLAVYCVDVRGGAKVRPRKRPENTVYTPFRVVHTQPDMDKWNGVVEASMEWEGVARFPLILRPCKRAGAWIAELPRDEQKMLFSLRQRVSVRMRAHLPTGQLLVSNLCMVRSKRADKPIVF